jgi:hypothetical protein
MTYVIKTGYVINDKPLPISDEADKILHEAAASIGAIYVGSTLGRGQRDMHYVFGTYVDDRGARAAVSDFKSKVKKLRPANASYVFIRPKLSKHD